MKRDNPKEKDDFSNMSSDELNKIIKMLTMEIDGGRGLPIPSWSLKIKRQFIRYLYRNLNSVYIAKVRLVDNFNKEREENL